ncbi:MULTISPECIES: Cj0069 family protein [unclassified Lysinibacillus]|uniref:Cj0069 family protein n=1 Tax=unclassified Lysinibacillus TaxID=2636778 RepID=UPI00232F8DF5|nr:Cj0069 family protein [Lysinibacillus sp. OF-1]WCH46130.1 Cj0069 family protein [Lysinibacillus sp. OF-1]
MDKKVIFFEVEGGTDKGPDGYRPDTLPMVDALKERGQDAEVLFFDVTKKQQIFDYVKEHGVAYVSRINPGNLQHEEAYFTMLRELCQAGIIGMPHPDAMISYGSKDALSKLTSTNLVPDDTYAYYTIEAFKTQFPISLASTERVLKQNRGSTGEGIWRVQLVNPLAKGITEVPLNAQIKCTEAKDNHVEYWQLGEFMTFCKQYITGMNGMLIDMRFLPRITEGEIRLFMLRNRPIYVVHKKPADTEDAFSATLFSGAQYRYDQPADWQELVQNFLAQLPQVTNLLGNYDLPLIWTADFMLDTNEAGEDGYILGEMNCSCVGFTSELSLAHEVAEEIIACIHEHQAALMVP